MRDLQVILTDVTAFSNETFGTDRPYTAPLHHLKKEVEEVIESGEVVEYADCLLLLLDSFRMKHPELDAQDLIESAYQKLKECRQRKWGKPDANGVIEHVRDLTNPISTKPIKIKTLQWNTFYSLPELCLFCDRIGKDDIQAITVESSNRYVVFYWRVFNPNNPLKAKQ